MNTQQQTESGTVDTACVRTIALTERECQFLAELLQREVTEVRSEIYHAESHDVKELLKEREACAKRLLQQFQHNELEATPAI